MPATPTNLDFPSLLRDAGLRATPGRIALLTVLAKHTEPLSVQDLEKHLKGALNQVTLYRALEALAQTGIVTRVNLEHEHAHFELVAGRPHHHHVICQNCGRVEDIDIPHKSSPTLEAQKQAIHFTHITRYSLEFFGICKKCS